MIGIVDKNDLRELVGMVDRNRTCQWLIGMVDRNRNRSGQWLMGMVDRKNQTI